MIIVNTISLDKPYSVISLVDGVGHAKSSLESKNMAIAEMVKAAEMLRADAIINVRFTLSPALSEKWLSAGYYSVIAYGTAVKFT